MFLQWLSVILTAQLVTSAGTSQSAGNFTLHQTNSTIAINNTTTAYVATTESTSGPVVLSIAPVRGPLLGGTKVTIEGYNLIETLTKTAYTVLINGAEAITLSKDNKRRIVVVTPPSNVSGALEIAFKANDTATLFTTSLHFVYTENPVVTDVHPKETILGGGIVQTITGRNFDWNQEIQMMVDSRISGCSVLSNTTLLCVAPAASSKLPGTNQTDVDISNPSYSTSKPMSISVNSVTILNDYINVFPNPLIEKFLPDALEFMSSQNLYLNITVTFPKSKIDWSEYVVVQLGSKRVCNNVEINQNKGLITCQPPSISPQVIRFGTADERKPDVIVNVGFVRTRVGQLVYINVEPFNMVMIVMIAVLSFILLISLVFGCLTIWKLCRSSRSKKLNNNNGKADEDIALNEKKKAEK